MITKGIAALISVLVMLSFASCSSGSPLSEKAEPASLADDDLLEVTFFDVGKADAIALLSKNSTVIVDCGEKGDAKEIIAFLEEKGRTSVDYLIITHYDKDHVGGAGKLIKNLDVRNVLAPDYDENSEEMDKYRSALETRELSPQLLTEDTTFRLDGIDYMVDAPDHDDYGEDDDNDFSLVTKVVHGNRTLLFTGDAMEKRIDEIMDIGPCDLLKVPYHGRKLDNLGDFLRSVKPQYAVVCTSQDEFAGSTQKLLIDNDITYYSTCFNGRITAVSDGSSISFTAERGT